MIPRPKGRYIEKTPRRVRMRRRGVAVVRLRLWHNPSSDREAALAAGAFGAKLTGAGGGGCMIALVNAQTEPAVARAIVGVGGTALQLPVAVGGGRVRAAPLEDSLR